jgi:H+/Cl- antiporter ClcA
MLCGYCRMTYSLTVIMLETTQAVNLFIPFLLASLSSYATALIFNPSLYTMALSKKEVPMLMAEVPL